MAQITIEMFVRWGEFAEDGNRRMTLEAVGPKVTKSSVAVVYGPRIEINGERYDLLMETPDSKRAIAVHSDDLIWMFPAAYETNPAPRTLRKPRTAELINGVWRDA